MMKRILIFTFALFISLSLSAQDNTVRLTVSGEGATKEEATANALKSAIEQAFGTFVSANTQILNDDIVKDEIATISSGNIQEYTELGCITMPDGSKSVSLSATVSIGNLISYAKSKGSTAEFAGAVFAMNIKLRQLNKENERKAIEHLFEKLNILAPNMFKIEIDVIGQPKRADVSKLQIQQNSLTSQPYICDLSLKYYTTPTCHAFYDLLTNTLKSLSLKQSEQTEYLSSNEQMYGLVLLSRLDLKTHLESLHKSQAYVLLTEKREKICEEIDQVTSQGLDFKEVLMRIKPLQNKLDVIDDYLKKVSWNDRTSTAPQNLYHKRQRLKDANSNLIIALDELKYDFKGIVTIINPGTVYLGETKTMMYLYYRNPIEPMLELLKKVVNLAQIEGYQIRINGTDQVYSINCNNSFYTENWTSTPAHRVIVKERIMGRTLPNLYAELSVPWLEALNFQDSTLYHENQISLVILEEELAKVTGFSIVPKEHSFPNSDTTNISIPQLSQQKMMEKDIATKYGAEDAYMLIVDSYDKGEFKKVENMVYALSDAGTPHDYWLAKSYIILGDSFVKREEYEQAKATFQSLVDSYQSSGPEDDILDIVNMRLKNIDEMMGEMRNQKIEEDPSNQNPNNNQSSSKVYSNAYDGYINIRDSSTSKGTIIGQFKNGPDGAICLSQTGEWTKINYKGVTGYVYPKYLSDSPTEDVTLSIDGNWLKGIWRNAEEQYAYLIFNNGTFALQSASGTLAYGTYMLKGNDIEFNITQFLSSMEISKIKRFRIDSSSYEIGPLRKQSFLNNTEMYGNSEGLTWTESQYLALRNEIRKLLETGVSAAKTESFTRTDDVRTERTETLDSVTIKPIPFQIVEEKPSFQGGDINQFLNWVRENQIYPEIAKENGIQGRVTVRATINTDGSLTDIMVVRGVDPSLDKEAIRVVSQSPKWEPGKQGGKAVPVTYSFPITFHIR